MNRRVSANRRGISPRERNRRRIVALLAPATVLAASNLLPAATAYWDSDGNTSGAGGPTPVGTWGTDPFWSSSANGDVATVGWNAGDTAVFSAGNDATGTFTVAVTGSQSVGGVTFEEGTLTLNGGALSILSATTTLAVTSPGVATIASQVTGSATTTIVKSGTGTLVLSNTTNSFTGGVTISAGKLRLGAANAMATQALTNAGTFDLNGFNQTVTSLTLGNALATNEAKVLGPGTLTVNGDITYKGAPSNQSAPATIASNISLPSGNHTLANANSIISNDVYDLVITGAISGAGSLIKGGSDNYLAVLTQQNTYTGTTTVNNGILFLGAANCLPTTSAITVNTGAAISTAIYDYPGVTSGDYNQQWTSLTGAGNVYIGSATLTIGATNASSTYSGGISDNTLGGKVTKLGSGNFVLAGGNDYRGVTTISAGTLTIGNAGTAGSIVGNVVNNSALAFNRTDTSTYAGNVSGSGSVTKSSTGVIVLTSTNTYTGATTITGGAIRAVDGVGIPGTSLTLNGGSYEPTTATVTRALGSGANQVRLTGGASGFSAFGTSLSVDIGGNGSGTGPTLTWGSSNFNPSSLILNATTATAVIDLKNAVDLAGAARTIAVNANTATVSGIVSGTGAASGLIKTGAGTLALRNTNTYAGTTTISGGVLDVTADSQLGLVPASPLGVSITINAATLRLGTNINSNRGITLNSTSAVIDTPTIDIAYAGIVGGTGNLTKTGTAALTLSTTANTYTGTTTVNAGRLNITADTSLGAAPATPTAAKLTLSNGTTLAALANLNLHVNRGLTLGAGGGTIDTGGFLVTLAGAIAGTANLTKLGAGTLVLTNAASTNSGTTIVNAGILGIAADGSLGSVPAAPAAAEVTLADATTLRAYGNANVHANRGLTLAGSSATIDSNGFNLTWAGVISGSGSITKVGAGTLALANSANTYAGTTTVSGGTLGIVADGSLGPIPASPTANELVINSATLRADADLNIAANRGLTIGGGNGATFDTQSFATGPGPHNITFNGVIAGTGDLKVTGAGTLFLRSNANSYSGATVVTGATLNVTSDAQLGAVPGAPTPDKIQLAGTLQSGAVGVGLTINPNRGMTLLVGAAQPTLDTQAFGITYGGVIAGAGSLTKNGSATLQLRGVNTYFGATTLNGGTLNILSDAQLGTPPASPTPARIVLNGATLQVAGSMTIDANRGMSVIGATTSTIDTGASNVTYAGAITATGALAKVGGGMLSLGTNNGGFSGPLSVSGGPLFAAASSSLGDASASNTLTLSGGATLFATGPILGPTRDLLTSGIGTINTSGFDAAFGNVSTSGNSAFTKAGAGNLTVKSVRLGGGSSMLSVAQGTLAIAPDGGPAGVNIVTSTNILAAELDLSNNHLIDHTSGVAVLTTFIQNGRNGGAWNDNGIVTSQSDAQNSNFTTLGIASAAQVKAIDTSATSNWAGQVVTGSDTLVMYTYGGDANLDGKINVDDYGQIDFNASLPGVSGWFNGDFNYDGKINVDDYGIIDFNVGIQGAPFFTAGSTGGATSVALSSLNGVSTVPEPACAAMLITCGLAVLSVRRRRTNCA